MNQYISIIVIVLLAVGCFFWLAGKDSIKAASEQPMQVNVEQTIERKIP